MAQVNTNQLIASFGLHDAYDYVTDCTGDIYDAIAEAATAWGEYMYIDHGIRNAYANDEVIREMLSTGYALSSTDFMDPASNNGLRDYAYYLGCLVDSYQAENALHAKLPELVQAVALTHLEKLHGDSLDAAAWDDVKQVLDGYDRTADLDDVREVAASVYADATRKAA